jgi:hypothetical protein
VDDWTLADVNVTCDDGAPKVDVTVSADTTVIFGSLVLDEDEITTGQEAAAITDVPQVGESMRPLAMCSAQIPSGPYGSSTAPQKIYFPSAGGGHQPPEECNVGKIPGNWWLLDCPGEKKDLVANITNGCENDVSVIPGVGGADGVEELTEIILDECPINSTPSATCLSGATGNITQAQVVDAWKGLVDSGDSIILPVFCVPPQCSAPTAGGDGTNATYPVSRLVAVQVCGFHFSKHAKDNYAPANPPAPCDAAQSAELMADGSDDGYMLLVFSLVASSGSTADIGGCDVGNETCDGGQRRVAMVE